ncbi:MAG: hypothetical protein SPL73_09085 [Cyanobacteriota bacterium]|nr:hypothetical protein [Cyanobacteriota bacterium]
MVYIIYFAIVLVLSPKNDLKNRGFIACTKSLVINLGECESGQTGCVLSSFYDDTKCNSKVIFNGFMNWLKGNQSAPWSNYIFEPELQEKSENPYIGNIKEDMQQIELDRKFMKEKENELEIIKNKKLKAQENVIIYDPEVEEESVYNLEIKPENNIDFESDIDDEAAIGELTKGDEKSHKIEQLPEKKIKTNSEKISQKAKNEIFK